MIDFDNETNDYFVCKDDSFNDKKAIRSFHEWERLYYERYYPNIKPTYRMYLEFLEWHYRYLSFRYSKRG